MRRRARMLLTSGWLAASAGLLSFVPFGGPAEGPPAPKAVTLKADSVPLSKALEEFKKQTGVEVVAKTKADPALRLDLNKAPFWQALDAVALEAKARVSLAGGLSLVDAPEGQPPPPVSYSRFFRTSLRRLSTGHDFTTGDRPCVALLEVAWEPGFQPFYLDKLSRTFAVQDEKGAARKVPDEGTATYHVTRRDYLEIDARLPSFRRDEARIGLFSGRLHCKGTSRMALLTFDKWYDKGAAPQSVDEAKVKLGSVVVQGSPWSVQVELTYPAGGPKFESHQNWLTHNEASLEGRDGKRRLRPSGQSIDRLTDNQAVVTYFFSDNKEAKVFRGKPEDWKLELKVPARLLELEVPFEFKDVPLP